MSSSRPKGRATQRPTSRSKRAQKPRHQPPSLVHLLEFDAGGLNFASELCGFVGVDVLDRLEAVSGGAKRAVGLSPISLALTAKEEAAPLAAVLAAHPLRRPLRRAARAGSLVVLFAGEKGACPGGRAHVRLKRDPGAPLYRRAGEAPGVVAEVAAGARTDPLAEAGLVIVDTSGLGSSARCRRLARRLEAESRRHRLCASPLRGAGAALGACLDAAAAALSTKLGNCGGKDVGRFLVALAARALDAPDQRVDVDDFEAAARAAPRGETRDRAARGTARAALDGAALFALALSGDLPPLVKASESAAAFAHPWVAAALASRFRTASALLEHRAARGPPPAWRLPALLAFAALDTQQDRDKCLDALARRATPLSDGDGVHVCEEHGGVTMKAAVVVDAAPDVADRRPFGPLSSHVVVKLSTAGVPKGSDAYRAAANADPVKVIRWRVRRADACGVAALFRLAASEGEVEFLDGLGKRGVDLVTPVDAEGQDGAVHRAARAGRAACAAVLSKFGCSKYTCCATGHQASVLAQAATLLPDERAATTRALDRVAADDWFDSRLAASSDAVKALVNLCGSYAGTEAKKSLAPMKRLFHAERAEDQREVGFLCLAAACRSNRPETVKVLVDTYGCDPDGLHLPSTPLHVAVQDPRRVDCVAALLARCQNPTRVDARGVDAVRWAGKGNNAAAVRLLAAHALVRPLVSGFVGNTALQAAAFSGFADVAEALLDHGADATFSDDEGWTALMLAAQNGHADVCDLLVRHGARVGARTREGYTALMACSKDGHADVAALLLGEADADVSAATQDGYTALIAACNYGHADVVGLCLRRGADVESKLSDGWSALMAAACVGDSRVVALLLHHGADPEAGDASGYTALMCAASQGRDAAARLLLERCVDVERGDRNGDTALAIACLCGHAAVVEVLLEHGADATRSEDDGCTALMNACYGSNGAIAKTLVDHAPAVVHQADDLGRTALMISAESGDAKIAADLLRAGADCDRAALDGRDALHLAAQHGHLAVVHLLLKHLDQRDHALDRVDRGDACGVPALVHAVAGGHAAVARALLKRGAAPAHRLFANDAELENRDPSRRRRAATTPEAPGASTAVDADALAGGDGPLAAWATARFAAVEAAGATAQKRAGRSAVARVRGRPTQCLVGEDQTCAFVGFNTVCALDARAPVGARVYYEVVIGACVGVVQLGWLGAVHETDVESGDGVGDDKLSWGVDGIRAKKWHDGDRPYATAKWKDGDVVTAAADLATGDLRFAVNGDWAAADATAFPNIAVPSDGLVPALTGGYGFVCTINLGDRPFKCRPPDASYRPVAPGGA